MMEPIIIGLSIASILVLVALGLAIVYGTMNIINMAHGEMVMIGAYTAVLCTIHLGLHIIWAIPVAFLVTGAIGYALEYGVVRHLYGRLLDTLLATWGLALILQQLIRIEFGAVFLGFHIKGLGPGLQNVAVPEFLQTTITIGDASVATYRAFILLVTVALIVITWWLINRTSFGTQLRAVSRRREMAACCGIDDKRINSLTFAYGSGLAGVAGVMVAGFKTVSPEMGTPYVIEAFLVVVAGGVGSLFGTIGAAGLLGEIQAIVANVLNDVYGRTVVFATVILILLFRPQGLFARKER
jgi:urea transport system permease protein